MSNRTFQKFEKRLESSIVKSMQSKKRAFTTGFFIISENLAKSLKVQFDVKGICAKSNSFNLR